MPTLSFSPSQKSIDATNGTNLLAAVRQAGFTIPASCGGKGLCGKCRVKVIDGTIPADERQRFCLAANLLDQGWRASCIVEIQDDLILADPESCAGEEIILTDFQGKEPDGDSGLWTVPCELHLVGDEESSIIAALQTQGKTDVIIPLEVLADIADSRDKTKESWAIGLDMRLIRLEKARTSESSHFGLAVDLGTTTLAAVLCDMSNGHTLSIVSAANPQAKHGDDVISRAEYASVSPANAEEMRFMVADSINSLAAAALKEAGATGWPVFTTIAGNPIMNHLLLGMLCHRLTTSPFIPVFRRGKYNPVKGSDHSLWYVLPNISAYVGGDIVAGLLAHQVCEKQGHVLFMDVGTNGEIVLVSNGSVTAAAAAAGPAFEGARIRQGMRASPGAVAGVSIDEDGRLLLSVIDGREAKGICGTGLLSAVSLLLREKIIDEGGKLRGREEVLAVNPEIPVDLLARIFHSSGQQGETAFWLARPGSAHAEGVALTQQDIREFQLAKGAVAAGAQLLLDEAGIRADQLDSVVLAGGFGSYLDPVEATGTGLIPAGVATEKIHAVGNSSLAGARLCLLSRRDRDLAEHIADQVGYIELSTKPAFQMAFAEGMLFPST